MSTIILDHVNVWSPERGEPLEDAAVVIDKGVICDITAGGKAAASGETEVVNGGGRWLLPGFVDAHAHLWGARSADHVTWMTDPRTLAGFRAVGDIGRVLDAGFTTLREAGGSLGPAMAAAITEGSIRGPKLFPAYLGISRTGGHGDCHSLPLRWVKEQPYMATLADGCTEVRKAVRTVAREGGKWVKVWASGAIAMSDNDNPEDLHFGIDELETIVNEAHAVGLRVGAHVEFPTAIEACLEAGIDVVEHGFLLEETTTKTMAGRGVPMVATMALLHRYLRWQGKGITEEQVDKARTLLPRIHASAKLAYDAGVTIAIGSDSFAEYLTPYDRGAEELLALREAGLPPHDCLTALTINGAKVIGNEDHIGSVEVGKLADLVVTNHTNPLQNLNAVIGPENISLVVKDGVPVGGNAFNRRLQF